MGGMARKINQHLLEGHQRKERQLGMKLGTAHHRLRVRVMFSLVVECGRDKCYRCGLKLTSASDFSIDHKQPWIGENTDLYWDLNNIAFAHKICNGNARRNNPDRSAMKIKLRKIGPPGTLWCNGHMEFIAEGKFSKNISRWSGRCDTCRDCRQKSRSPRKHAKRMQCLNGSVLLGEEVVSKATALGSNPGAPAKF